MSDKKNNEISLSLKELRNIDAKLDEIYRFLKAYAKAAETTEGIFPTLSGPKGKSKKSGRKDKSKKDKSKKEVYDLENILYIIDSGFAFGPARNKEKKKMTKKEKEGEKMRELIADWLTSLKNKITNEDFGTKYTTLINTYTWSSEEEKEEFEYEYSIDDLKSKEDSPIDVFIKFVNNKDDEEKAIQPIMILAMKLLCQAEKQPLEENEKKSNQQKLAREGRLTLKREDRKEKFLKKIETFNIENYETTIKIPIYREISDFNNTAIWSVNIVGNSNLKQSHIMDKYFGLIYEKNVIKLGPKDQLGENFFTYTGIKDREQKNKIKEKPVANGFQNKLRVQNYLKMR